MISIDNRIKEKKELFKNYYSSESFLDKLILPPRANFHHFRCELFTTKGKKIFRKVKDVIRKKQDIQKILVKWIPKNIYYTPTQWLDPVNLRKCTDVAISDILLSYPLYFDVDSNSIQESLILTKKTVILIKEKYGKYPDLIVFSGKRGFHIYYWDWEDTDFNINPRCRIEKFIINRKEIIKILYSKNIKVDSTVSADPWRILRLPGTLHGDTGLAAISIIGFEDISQIDKAKVLPEKAYMEIKKLWAI